MSNESKYSINELENIVNDINKVVINSATDNSKLDRSLIFSLRVNMRKINQAIEIAEEELEDPIEGYEEFEREKMNVIQKYGGKIERDGNSYRLINQQEVFNNESFKEEMENLSEEYEEVIKKQNENFQKNTEIRQQEIAEVDWKKIPLSNFPEKISGNEFPLSFVEFVYDNKEK